MGKTLSQRIATEKLKDQAAKDLIGKPCVMCLSVSVASVHHEKNMTFPNGKQEAVHVIIPICMECIKSTQVVNRRMKNELDLAERDSLREYHDKSKQRQN